MVWGVAWLLCVWFVGLFAWFILLLIVLVRFRSGVSLGTFLLCLFLFELKLCFDSCGCCACLVVAVSNWRVCVVFMDKVMWGWFTI